MIKHTVELYLLKKSFTPSVNITQADTGHQIECTFPDFILPSGTTAKVWAIKPSGKIVYNDCIVSENTVLVNVTNQMAAEKGVTLVQLKLTNNGELVSSFPVHLKCSMDVSGNGIESENEITALDKFLEEQAKKLDAVIAEKTADIIQNKTDIVELKKDAEILKEDTSTLKKDLAHKADAIVETASGETIQVEDSSGLGFEGLRVFGRSTQDGTPTPESPVPIVNVGDKGNIILDITGKNLFDPLKAMFYEAYWVYENEKWNTKKSNATYVSIDMVLKAGVNYTFSVFCESIKNDEAKIEIRKDNATLVSSTTKTPGRIQVSYIPVSSGVYKVLFGGRDTGELTFSKPQLEISEAVTSYEPYRTPQSLTLATPNGLPGIKVDSDGNYTDSNGQQWICDEIDLERGKYVQRIEKNVYNGNGTELWTYDNKNLLFFIKPPNMKTASELMCDRYTENNKDASITTKRGGMESIFITDLSYTTLDDFKNGLAKRPLTVQFILSTPIETDLDPETIKTYKTLHTNYPTTVISNDESAHMEVSYVADTKNYIASKIETPLQKQIIDLQNALISQKISGGV